MEFITLNRQFADVDIIDNFVSSIWTERYYGDSETKLVVPATQDMVRKLPEGIFLRERNSDEVMILETANIKGELLELEGISLLSWMNNRFLRTTNMHEDKYWYPGLNDPTWILWAILYYWTSPDSPYLNSYNIGLPYASQLAIPGIVWGSTYDSGQRVDIGVPFGPLYDAMRTIANTYQIGMKLGFYPPGYPTSHLQYRNYQGLDRTSRQSTRPVVQFSAQMGNLANAEELRSIKNFRTRAYTFAPGLSGLDTQAGYVDWSPQPTGFDVRALMSFEDDITTDMVEADPVILANVLNSRAVQALNENHYVRTVDGEIVPGFQYTYGSDYTLGDLVEVMGKSGISQIARITEYIRTHDAAGEKAYPTVTMLE